MVDLDNTRVLRVAEELVATGTPFCLIPDLKRRWSSEVRNFVEILRFPDHANLVAVASRSGPNELGVDWIVVKMKCGATEVTVGLDICIAFLAPSAGA